MTTTHWRTALWLLMLFVVALASWQARFALLPFAIGAVLAYAISPVVDLLASAVPVKTHRADVWRRGIIVLLIYIAFFGALAAIGIALVPLAAEQIQQFIDDLPDIVEDARSQIVMWLNEYRARVPIDMQTRLESFAEDAAGGVATTIAAGAQAMITRVTSTFGIIFGFLIVPFFMFYAMRDRHFVMTNVLRAVPDAIEDDVRNSARLADYVFGRYIRGQLFLALVVGATVGVGLTLLGVQLSLGLAAWAGITELIPIIGPWLGAIPALIIVAATQPDLFVWVVLLYVGIQAAENYLLVPRIQSHAVDIHPAMVLVLLAVAGAIWGFLGMLVIIPITAILRELFWYMDHRLKGETPEEAFAHSRLGAREQDRPLDARIDAIPEDQQPPAESPIEAASNHRGSREQI